MAGKRTHQKPVWLDDEEATGVLSKAESLGIKPQEYIRYLIRQDLGLPAPSWPRHH